MKLVGWLRRMAADLDAMLGPDADPSVSLWQWLGRSWAAWLVLGLVVLLFLAASQGLIGR